MVPTIESDIDFTITGTNCSNWSFHFSLRPCLLKLIRGQDPKELSVFKENTGDLEGNHSSTATAWWKLEPGCLSLASSGYIEGWVPGVQIATSPLSRGLCVYKGKTKKPENVEYFQPPMRLPLSSLRCTLSSLSMSSRTPLLAASLVTSWSPANAEITG